MFWSVKMGDDYCMPGKRKSKNDRRKKRRQGVYKKGGKYRAVSGVVESNKDKGSNESKKGKKKKKRK